LFAGEHAEGMLNVQNEKKEMKMACSIPLSDLNLTPEQRNKMNAVLAEHMKTGCTEAGEANTWRKPSHHDSGAIREAQGEIRPGAKREDGRLTSTCRRIEASEKKGAQSLTLLLERNCS